MPAYQELMNIHHLDTTTGWCRHPYYELIKERTYNYYIIVKHYDTESRLHPLTLSLYQYVQRSDNWKIKGRAWF